MMMRKAEKKTIKFARPFVSYANKLEEFLKHNYLYDKEVCILLGVIAAQSARKHTALHDEICVAIASLRMHDIHAQCLINECQLNVSTGIIY